MVIQVLWLTEILAVPFWELHPLDPPRLFPPRIHPFWLDKIMKLVARNTLYMYPRNISKKLRLSACT
jgi:hypothetical protein